MLLVQKTQRMITGVLQVPPPKGVVVVISGPSGVGKDSVVERLKESRRDLYFVVTATSRCALGFPSAGGQGGWQLGMCVCRS